MKFIIFLVVLLLTTSNTNGGPLAYGICQTGCNALVVSCYAAAGFTFGTGEYNLLKTTLNFDALSLIFLVTAGAGVPAAIIACNAALGVCMAGCIAAGFAPTL